jgi:RNA polymerase sigma-70 factor (ECF subfamily)
LKVESSIEPVDEQLEFNEMKSRVDSAINGLPEKCRIVFTLSRFEELSHREISEQLGISVKTVENHMSKALKILKRQLL